MFFNMALARNNMVENQLRPFGVRDTVLLETFGHIPREKFIPSKIVHKAYADHEISLEGEGGILLSPQVLARLIEGANITKDSLVLVIGDPTGYASCVMSQLANTVLLLETKEFLKKARSSLQEKLDEFSDGNVVLMTTDSLAQGYKKEAPYDVILILGGAVDSIPEALLKQLSSNGGRLLAIQNERQKRAGAAIMISHENKTFSLTHFFDTYIPYMPEFQPDPGFSFI